MADKRITDLPLILSGDISSLDVLPIVNVELDITNKVTADQLKAYINSGITDVFVTGGTYNTTTGDATFTNNTGGTFSISGFYTGSTDVFVTGGTYSNGTTTFTNNTGGTFNVVGYYTGETSYVNSLTTGTGLSGDTTTGNVTLINTAPDQVVTITGGTNLSIVGTYPNFGVEFTGSTSSFFTGGTVSGATNFTNGLSADTFSATTISGGTLYGDGSNLTGIPDYYLTGLTFDNGTYFLKAFVNDGNTYQANLSILGGDLRVTGGTYNPGTGIGTFTNNSGATFDVSGFLTGYTDHYVTGFTYDNINTFTIYDNSGNTFSASINNLSATTISATTISATTYQNLPDNVTGYYLPLSGGTVTGTTTFTNGLTANTISATTYQNLPIDPDTYVTGYTYNNNTFIIKQNNGQPDLTATINSVTGLTVNGNLTVTGTTSLQGLSATTISATTIGSSGDCIDDIYVSNIHSCSPLNINPLSEGNVFFGSSVSGVTIDTTNNRLGLGTSTPQTALELVSNNTSSIGNVLRFRDSDTVVPSLTQQFIGKIEFFSNETSGGGTGVKSYVAGVQDANANSSIIFGATGGTGSLTALTASTTSVFTGERMRIDSIGNVGIGIIPSAKLHINNTTTGDTILIEDSTNPDTTPFVIDASGNTSIGSSTYLTAAGGVRPNLQVSSGLAGSVTLPVVSTPLAVQSNSSTTVSLFSPNANLSQITFGSPSDGYASIFRYTPTLKQLLLSTNNVGGFIDLNTSNGLFTMRVTSGQTVGIGTTNPAAKLHITKNSVSPNIILSDTGGITNDAYMRFECTSASTPSFAFGSDKSDANKLKITYSTLSSTNLSDTEFIGVTTGGTTTFGEYDSIQITPSGTSGRVLVKNGFTSPSLTTEMSQYSNFATISANQGTSIANEEFIIVNESVSGATTFRANTSEDKIYIYPSTRPLINGDSGVRILNSLLVNGSVAVGTPVANSGVVMYRNATTGVLGPLSSDSRLKQNIETIPNAMDIVKNLRGVYFNWKDNDDVQTGDTTKQIGLIAQEVEEHLPEAVINNGVKDYKTVKYSEMVSVLIEAMKEQQQQIDNLKSEIEDLKGRL